jgi:hypothetical protein
MPDELVRPHTEEEIEEMTDKLKNRGGSKINNVYDVIKHKKKKLRARQVMDQKANSIADLAAGLLEFGDLGKVEAVELEKSTKTQKEASALRAEVVRLVKLTNTYEADMQSMEDQIAQYEEEMQPEGVKKTKRREAIIDANALRRKRIAALRSRQEKSREALKVAIALRQPLQTQIEDLVTEIENTEEDIGEIVEITPDHSPSERAAINEKNALVEEKFNTEIPELRLKLEQMKLLLESLPTEDRLTNAHVLIPTKAPAEEKVEYESGSETTSITDQQKTLPEPAESLLKQMTVEERARYLGLEPGHRFYPPTEDHFPLPSADDLMKSNVETLKRLLPQERIAELKRNVKNEPFHTTEGITVQWADIYDAQFAKEWPDSVKHERMGIVRHKPPAPADARPAPVREGEAPVYPYGHPVADAPAFDVATFKASQWRRTRGVPTESTPVDFARPKYTSHAPWLQTDAEKLEDLQARQRAWNSAHSPLPDADGTRHAPYAASAENTTDSSTKTSYEVAVERKERMDALGDKLIQETLPEARAGPVPQNFVKNVPRITNLEVFKTLPGTQAEAAEREKARRAVLSETERQMEDAERAEYNAKREALKDDKYALANFEHEEHLKKVAEQKQAKHRAQQLKQKAASIARKAAKAAEREVKRAAMSEEEVQAERAENARKAAEGRERKRLEMEAKTPEELEEARERARVKNEEREKRSALLKENRGE